MSLCAIIPVANIVSANAALEAAGFGPQNFQVACYTGQAITHGALHTWSNLPFETAVKALAGVIWEESDGDPKPRTKTMIEARGCKWGDDALPLPSTGTVTAGSLFVDGANLWYVIQTFSRDTYGGPPEQLAQSIIRRIGRPGVVCAWWQPLDQFDACKLVNPFTGKPDVRIHNGKKWKVTQADGAGNNVWEPGVFGWTEIPF